MIKKINKITNFGIFKDFHWSNSLDEFNRFNLLYGWNGCGKTTFSKLCTLVEYKDDANLLKNLIGYEFSFDLIDGTSINQSNYLQNNLNIHVYNEVFKKKNIDWDNVVKSILLISDDVITEKTELDKNKLQLGSEDDKTGILGDIKKQSEEKKSLETNIEDFYSKSAKKIKEEFKVIDTSDTYYFNYDKRKFKSFLETNKEKIKTKESILEMANVDRLKESIKPNILPKVELDIKLIEATRLQEIEKKVSNVLEANLVVNEIERLKKYPDIGSWVEQGIKIHKDYKSTECEFCNQTLPVQRIEELERHFSRAFLELKEKISKALEWLPTQKILDISLDNEIEFYPEYQETFKKTKKNLKNEIKKIDSIFDQWISLLKSKLSNPFEIIKLENIVYEKTIETYNQLVD